MKGQCALLSCCKHSALGILPTLPNPFNKGQPTLARLLIVDTSDSVHSDTNCSRTYQLAQEKASQIAAVRADPAPDKCSFVSMGQELFFSNEHIAAVRIRLERG